MTFFLEISIIWACITRFSEIVAKKSGDVQKNLKQIITILAVAVMLLDINWNRFQDWCAEKFV